MARTEPVPAAERLDAPDARVALVCSGFHRSLAEALIAGARGEFAAAGVAPDRVEVHWVPGSFEVPQAAKVLAATGRYGAIVALGAVIRGQTAHFDHVAMALSQGLIRVGLDTGVPCTFGVLTCDSVEQAWARAGGEVGNAGQDAARAAVSLMNLGSRARAGQPRTAAAGD